MKELVASALEITFIDAAPPPLPAGDFQLNLHQQVAWKGGQADQPVESGYDFSVFGPRFTLDPVEIHAVFPPPNNRGHFQQYLPHIIFRRRSVPWERTLGGMPESNNPSWLWLLSLSAAEIKTHGIKIQTVPLKDIFNSPDPGVIKTPTISPETGDDPESQAYVIDVPVTLFQELVPSKTDLELSASARLVSVIDKAITPSTEDGWFSSVMANRFTANGEANTQFLVSLEGYEDILYPNPVGGTFQKVRLAMLANWQFENIDDGQTFDQLMNNLSVDRLQLPTPTGSAEVAQAFSQGYAPFNHGTLEGPALVSWYRGPLLPMDMPLNMPKTFENSDEALRYDPEYGMFDVSYAAAIQIGRLLGLQSEQFARAVANLRGFNQAAILSLSQKASMVRAVGKGFAWPRDAQQLAQRQIFSEQFLDWWGRVLGPATQAPQRILGEPADPSGLRDSSQELPGLLTPDAAAKLIDETVQSIINTIFRQ